MGLCIAVCLAAVILIYVCKIKGEWYVIRRPCLVLCIFGALGIFSGIADAQDKTYGQLERNPPGEGELETEAYVYFVEEGTEYGLTLSIPEQKYKPSKEQELLAAAVEVMQQTFCGNNTSVYEISQNPDVRESYQDGAVSAEWLFSERALISAEGELDQKAVKKLGDGTHKVEAAVTFVCGESMQEYTFAFWVAPGKRNRKEELEIAVEAQIAGQDRTSSRITLPGYIDGEEVRWRAPPSVQPEEVLGLGALAAAAVWYAAREKQKQEKEKRKRGLFLAYPEFVSKLALLLGAGMGISSALRKMDQMYAIKVTQGGKKEEAYEALHRMVCEMDNGMGELRAYQAFCEDCDLQPYRKLVSLLISGQKVGNRKLLEQLNEEAGRVFTERKNAARRLGEEAGTKLLIPMMIMLAIVMAIVIIPAFLAVNGI